MLKIEKLQHGWLETSELDVIDFIQEYKTKGLIM
jgi:phosphoribosylformimino-5-aminoimidazole carboxamide ribonucleotide (ProFAR) isomerase